MLWRRPAVTHTAHKLVSFPVSKLNKDVTEAEKTFSRRFTVFSWTPFAPSGLREPYGSCKTSLPVHAPVGWHVRVHAGLGYYGKEKRAGKLLSFP